MNIAIISSSNDPAGVNIRKQLIELFKFEDTNETFDDNPIYQYAKIKNNTIKSYLINDDLIYSDNIDKKINADVFIFASKHRSKENTKSFAVHSIGNWDTAELGGKEKTLCISSAVLLKSLFIELNENGRDSGYEITLEATHHGPFVEKPAVFIEIGSTLEEWSNKTNGEIIAKTIINSLKNQNHSYKIAVGIGGPHYCSNFNKVMLRTDIALSHICPKYHLQHLDENILNQSIKKTKEKVDFILLDWKGLGTEKQRVLDMAKNLNLECKRTEYTLKD